jgi:hypothetical protein
VVSHNFQPSFRVFDPCMNWKKNRYDELHPSEQADRMVAKQIAEVATGKANRWTTWLSYKQAL